MLEAKLRQMGLLLRSYHACNTTPSLVGNTRLKVPEFLGGAKVYCTKVWH